MGPSLTTSEINGDFGRKSQNFATSGQLTRPLRGSFKILNFVTALVLDNLVSCPYQMVERVSLTCAFVSIHYQRVTDRQTDLP